MQILEKSGKIGIGTSTPFEQNEEISFYQQSFFKKLLITLFG